MLLEHKDEICKSPQISPNMDAELVVSHEVLTSIPDYKDSIHCLHATRLRSIYLLLHNSYSYSEHHGPNS